MIASFLMALFSIGVALTVISLVLVERQPYTSFLLSMFAVLIFATTAYEANWIEVYDVYVTNTTSVARTVNYTVLGVPTVTRSVSLQWLSIAGMILNAILLWFSSIEYGGGR